jgi:M6 family metalloprotease-like protein
VTNVAVSDSSFFYVGDVVTFGTGSTTRTITAIPDSTHITVSSAITVAASSQVQDCLNTNFDSDATNLWHQQANCTGNCGADVHLFIYAGYDETSVWQEFGPMLFQNKEDVPRAVWGNPNPAQPNWVISRYVDWTSWFAGEQQWGESSVRQGESSGTITHELSHNIFSVGDNNNNPYATPYHRVGSGPWDMMDRGSFNGPGGPHNRWEVPAQFGASMGAEHTLRSKIGMGFVDPKTVLTLNRNGLAQSGLAVADVVARAVNTDPGVVKDGVRAGVQINFDGASPVDHEPACDVNTQPLCDGGGANGRWSNYMLEAVQRIGYGSFEPDQGVLISKDKTWNPGTRGTEGSQCGYNCFTWVEDAHPEDIDMVDYLSPNGTPVMRTVADYRQLDDALFHAGTSSGSSAEYVDAANSLHFYVVDTYTDASGYLHYVLGIQNPAGAGPQTRGVSLANAASQTLSGTNTNCRFQLTNSGTDAATDPALHPQDETASFHNDIYRLAASVSGDGWTAQLRNALATARFGQSISVPVYVTRSAAPAANATVTLTATSVSDPSKTATATCALAAPTSTVGGTVPATLSLTLGGPATFGAFTPGVARDYTASTTGNVISTAGDAALTVSDPGHMTNGSFSLPEPLRVSVSPSSWAGPVSNGPVAITFNQLIKADDALRTGTYSKTVTFTLSTTNP